MYSGAQFKFIALYKYQIDRVSWSQDFVPYKCCYAVFKLSANIYDLELSNELLFIIIAYEAAKL